MLQRQRVLLDLMNALHEKNIFSRTITDKLLFLLAKEYGIADLIKFYSFFPYRFGPFSALFYYDMRSLESRDFISQDKPTGSGIEEAKKLDDSIRSRIREAVGRFRTMDDLVAYVYSKYPEYTVRSELTDGKHENKEPAFFSIGYQGKDLDAFLDLLVRNNVQVLVDVRRNPFSMQFFYTKENLKRYLRKVGIDYLHLPELGIDGKYRKNLNSPEDYAELFKTYKKSIDRKGLETLIGLGTKKRIAFMCMERDYHQCHRGVISSELERLGHQVTHL